MGSTRLGRAPNHDSGVGTNQSEFWTPQKRLLEAEIDRLKETNKHHRHEMVKALQRHDRLEADLRVSAKNTRKLKMTAERERVELESAYRSALDRATSEANEMLETEYLIQ